MQVFNDQVVSQQKNMANKVVNFEEEKRLS